MRWLGVSVGLILLLMWTSPVWAAVAINEFLPAPSSGNKEWVEFYNPDSSTIDLSDYFFDDDSDFQSDSGSSGKIAIAGLLAPTSTCYWDLSTYLNNNGDTPTLFNTAGTTIDSYTYTKTTTDKSYVRVPDGGEWQADQAPTKSSANCLDLAPTPTPTPTATPTPTPTSAPTSTPAPTTIPTITPKPTAAAQVLAAKTEVEPDNEVTVAAEIQATATPSATPQPKPEGGGKWAWLMIVGGGGLVGAALFPFLRKWYDEGLWRKMFSRGGDQSSFGQE